MAGGLAADAMKYNGARYVFGGAPANGIGNWDCSSFVNWCAGHDLGMAIPGMAAGTYTGKSHGPVVLDWATWTGASTIHGSPAQNDLCIWAGAGALGHMGIALSGDHMISAYDTAKGTIVTPIRGYGPPGAPLMFRRLTGGGGGGLSMPTGCVPLIYYIWLASNALQDRREHRRKFSSRQRGHRRRQDEIRDKETG